MKMKLSEAVALVILGLPVLGIFMGGIYSLPAMYLTKERDPWLTAFLAGGLAITVFGLGHFVHVPPLYLAGLWLVSLILLLLARRLFGTLGHNLERFGMVHMATLLLVLLLSVFRRHLHPVA